MTTQNDTPQRRAGAAQGNKYALRHGLFAKGDLIKGEDHNEYMQLTTRILEEEGAVGAVESQLATRMVGLMWRLGRIGHLEGEVWKAADTVEEKLRLLERLAIYEGRLSRELERVRKELSGAQANRKARTETAAESGLPEGRRDGARAGKVEKTISPRPAEEIWNAPRGDPNAGEAIESKRG